MFSLYGIASLLIASLASSCSTTTEDLEFEETNAISAQDFILVPDAANPLENIVTGQLAPSIDDNIKKKEDPDKGRFEITLRYLVPPTPRQIEVFEAAKERWERIIIQDEPSITGSIPSAFIGIPPITGTTDDIVIEVVLTSIDGPNGILGQAGPRFVRTDGGLPISGFMLFDTADLAFLDQLDLFEDVIVHEMGHVLGIGTLWNSNGRNLRQGPLTNPYFTGKMANVHWGAEGGTDALPIENSGDQGTRLSHWRESILVNELMTGFLNLGENPLSRITAGSVRDLGYGSAMVGEKYDLPKGTPGVDLDDLDGSSATSGLHIAEKEVLFGPIGYLTVE